MQTSIRTNLIKWFTFLGGIYFIVEFILPQTFLDDLKISEYHEPISDGFVLIGAMALGLGIINLLYFFGSKLIFKRKGWFYSLVLLTGLFVMTTVSFLDWRKTANIANQTKTLNMLSLFADKLIKEKGELEESVELGKKYALLKATLSENLLSIKNNILKISNDLALKGEGNEEFNLASKKYFNELKLFNENIDSIKLEEIKENIASLSAAYAETLNLQYKTSKLKRIWTFLYEGLIVSLSASMFSLLGVYIAIAAYRAFRLSSLEAGLMLLAALVVMLGQVSFGSWIYDGFPELRNWLLKNPNTSAFRAIRIGAAVAGLIMAFRMWLSIESDFSKEQS